MAGFVDIAMPATVVVFMIGSLIGVGLAATPRAAVAPLRQVSFVTLTLVNGWVVCPLVAWLLLYVVPIDRPYAVALLLLSLAPAAPFAPAMMRIAGADSGYAAAFMILATVATVAIMPVVAPLLIDGVSAAPRAIALPLVGFVLLPLLLGVSTRQFDPDFADLVQRPITTLTNVAGLVLLVLIAILYSRGVLDAVGSHAIPLQIVFVSLVTVLAHGLGRGLPGDQRSVLTLGMCSRNLGAALVPLMAIEHDPRAMVMLAIAAPVTVVISLVAARWLARAQPPATRGPGGHRHTIRPKAAGTA